MVKVYRAFYGSYAVSKAVQMQKKHFRIPSPFSLFLPKNNNQGFGKVSGSTKKLGGTYSPVTVCLFRRDTRQLLWETTSNEDGSYIFRNVAVGLGCFIVAFDPNNQYNALIQDNILPFDGRVG